jgi:[acyl-carrier-protein] S-malonyltransferase
MGKDFHDAFEASRRVYDRAREVLGWDVAARCFEGPLDDLSRTAVSQPAIFVTSLAVVAALEASGVPDPASASAAAGLSLGEYTALVFARAIDFYSALRIVQRRGQIMEEACHASPGGMVSVIGLDETAVRVLCHDAAEGRVLTPANFNSPEQIVLSGHLDAVERAAALAQERGAKRAIPLKVEGAFHSPLMSPAAEAMRPVLEAAPLATPAFDVVPNATAEPTRDAAALRRALIQQVDHPVRWNQAMHRLLADGFTRFVEVAPGKVLTGLLRRIDRNVEAVNVADVAGLRSLAGRQ